MNLIYQIFMARFFFGFTTLVLVVLLSWPKMGKQMSRIRNPVQNTLIYRNSRRPHFKVYLIENLYMVEDLYASPGLSTVVGKFS